MPKYVVAVPCTMSVLVYVEAKNKESAKTAALNASFVAYVKPEIIPGNDVLNIEVDEFEAHECITKGNFFYGVQNEVKVRRKNWI
jgi:hypothetical protein